MRYDFYSDFESNTIYPGKRFQELLDSDTHPVPSILREQSPADFEDQMFIPKTRYTSRAYHELEKERVWKKVW